MRKSRSEDLGVMRSQKDLNSNFALQEGFNTFCRSALDGGPYRVLLLEISVAPAKNNQITIFKIKNICATKYGASESLA